MITIVLIGAGVALAGGTYVGVKKGWFKKKNETAAEASGKEYNGPTGTTPTV